MPTIVFASPKGGVGKSTAAVLLASELATGPSRSHADHYWCKVSARRGWSIEETEKKLLEVSEKARERIEGGDKGYAHICHRSEWGEVSGAMAPEEQGMTDGHSRPFTPV